MKTRIALSVALAALVVAACGDSDDDASTSDDPAPEATSAPADGGTEPAEEPADDEEPTDEAEPGDEAVASGGLNRATITVGDQTYDFEWETSSIQVCNPDFFGGFMAIAATTGDQPSFDAELFEEGTVGFEDRAPRVEVSDPATDASWTADAQELVGTTFESWPANVDSLELDGNRASGTATFVGQTEFGEEPVGVPGTFEITCAG